MTVWTRTVYLKTGTILQTASKDCSFFLRRVWGSNYMRVLTILYKGTTMTMWTRTVCLKTEVVLQTVLKDHNYVMRRVCFQELHIMVQYVRYEKIVSATKNKRLLGFYRKYITFKSKEWINLRVKMSLSFSWILLLKNCYQDCWWKALDELCLWQILSLLFEGSHNHSQNIWDKI